jgi:hypothetical protein
MKSYSPNVDEILLRAKTSAFLGILGVVALTFALNGFGLTVDDRYIFVGMMAYNLIPTWHIVRAVKMLGKNPWLYGGISIIGIPFSLLVSSILMIPRDFQFLTKIFGNRKK